MQSTLIWKWSFFPKFHCEFNWIERYWGNVKCSVRKRCDYTFKNLEKTVPECLDAVSVLTLQKFARKSYRYIDAYRPREGDNDIEVTPELVEWNVKQYRSHRRIDRLLKVEEKLEITDGQPEDEEGEDIEAEEVWNPVPEAI